MGLSMSNPSTTLNSKLLVTKSNTAGQTLVGPVNLSAPSGGSSSWGQVTASASADTLVTGVGFYGTISVSGVAAAVTFEIAIGGAGSEVTLATVLIPQNTTAAGGYPGGWADLKVPQRIAAGQRIAVRGTQVTSFGATSTLVTYLATVPYVNTEGN